jgi:ribonuclease HI
MKLFFDGGCRPNPGPMETAVVAGGILHHQRNLGVGSSEEAEWLALLHALTVAKALGLIRVDLRGDSASVINQVIGATKPRTPAARNYLVKFEEEARHFERVRVRFLRRTQNLAGIALDKVHDR